MSQDLMRTVLFVTFMIILVVTFTLVVIATIRVISGDSTSELWKFVYFSWSGVVIEIIGLIVSLGRNLFGFHSDELIREIARKYAEEIVTEASGVKDLDPHRTLDTAYRQTKEDLRLHFKSQGKQWLDMLEKEFRDETTRGAHSVSVLRTWVIPSDIPSEELAPQDLKV